MISKDSAIYKWQNEHPKHWRKDSKIKEHIPGNYLSPTEAMRWKVDGPEAKEIQDMIDGKKPNEGYSKLFLIMSIQFNIGARSDMPLNLFTEDEAGSQDVMGVRCIDCEFCYMKKGVYRCEVDEGIKQDLEGAKERFMCGYYSKSDY